LVNIILAYSSVAHSADQCCRCPATSPGSGGQDYFTPYTGNGQCNTYCLGGYGPTSCPVPPKVIPGPKGGPGTNAGSFRKNIGGPNEESRCEIETAHFLPT